MKCPNEIIKKMEEMEVKINKYEKNYNDKKQSLGAAVSSTSVISNGQEQQEIELKGLRQDFDKLKALVHSMLPRTDKIERETYDLEQYGRSNCLIAGHRFGYCASSFLKERKSSHSEVLEKNPKEPGLFEEEIVEGQWNDNH